jgi:hypothetical protein
VWLNSETKEILFESENVKEESPVNFELTIIEGEPPETSDFQSYHEQPSTVDFKVQIQNHYLTESTVNCNLPPPDNSTYDAAEIVIKSEHESDIELEQHDQEIGFKRSASRESSIYSQNSKYSTILESSSGTNCNCCYGCLKYKQERRERRRTRAYSKHSFNRRRRNSSSSIEVSEVALSKRVGAAKKIKLRRKRCKSVDKRSTNKAQQQLLVLRKKSIILKSKLHKFLLTRNNDYDKENLYIRLKDKLPLATVYKHIKVIDIFSSLLIDLKVMASNGKRGSDGDGLATGKKIKVQDGAEQSGEGTSTRYTKKKQFNKKIETAINKVDSDSEKDNCKLNFVKLMSAQYL